MKHSLIFTTTAIVGAALIFMVMSAAWCFGRLHAACASVDRVVNNVFEDWL